MINAWNNNTDLFSKIVLRNSTIIVGGGNVSDSPNPICLPPSVRSIDKFYSTGMSKVAGFIR